MFRKFTTFVCCLVQIAVVYPQWTAKDYAQILSGSGKAALKYPSSQKVDVTTLYSNFPQCQSLCGTNKPCAEYLNKQDPAKSCVKSGTYSDTTGNYKQDSSSISYCPGLNQVCCYPGLCRRPVVSCSYDVPTIVKEREPALDVDSLGMFALLADDDVVNDMDNKLTSIKKSATECNRDCNGWTGTGNGVVAGDISKTDCTSKCKCKSIAQPQLQASGEYVCVQKSNIHGKDITTFHMGNKEASQHMKDNRAVCGVEETCSNEKICMSFATYQELLKKSPKPTKPATTAPTPTMRTKTKAPDVVDTNKKDDNKTDEVSNETYGYIIGACAVGLAAVFLGVYLVKRPKKEPAGDEYAAMDE